MDINQNNITENNHARRHKLEGDTNLRLRNILNIIFMIGAIVGVAIYMTVNRTAGTIVILVAMLFKIVECVFRLKR